MDKPILMSTEMVRAILDGRKTQTRRVVKPQPRTGFEVQCIICGRTKAPRGRSTSMHIPYCDWQCSGYEQDPQPDYLFRNESEAEFGFHYKPKCPYGTVGDWLYVRETWAPVLGSGYNQRHLDKYENDDSMGGFNKGVVFKASPHPDYHIDKWTPSIHMPKKFARIWLENENVWVQWLPELTDEQARAEGFKDKQECFDWFRKAYGTIEKWVWVVEFKVVE